MTIMRICKNSHISWRRKQINLFLRWINSIPPISTWIELTSYKASKRQSLDNPSNETELYNYREYVKSEANCMFLLITNSQWQSSFLWKIKEGGIPLPLHLLAVLSLSFPSWIAVCHFSFTTWNNTVRESLTMLQLDNFPADGSIITGLPNGVCMHTLKKKNDEDDPQVFKFLKKPALLKMFQDWHKALHYWLVRQSNNKTKL